LGTGGLKILGTRWDTPAVMRRKIRATRALTSGPSAVNLATVLVPLVCGTLRDVPVIAAAGIADARNTGSNRVRSRRVLARQAFSGDRRRGVRIMISRRAWCPCTPPMPFTSHYSSRAGRTRRTAACAIRRSGCGRTPLVGRPESVRGGGRNHWRVSRC
jgi:hypothetical protein